MGNPDDDRFTSLVPCPNCKSKKTKVIEFEGHDDRDIRYVECLNCGHKYKTEEKTVPGSIIPGPSIN